MANYSTYPPNTKINPFIGTLTKWLLSWIGLEIYKAFHFFSEFSYKLWIKLDMPRNSNHPQKQNTLNEGTKQLPGNYLDSIRGGRRFHLFELMEYWSQALTMWLDHPPSSIRESQYPHIDWFLQIVTGGESLWESPNSFSE